jgi:hypothetical protein
MKKLLFILILIGSFSVVNAQFLNFGIKGGVNYNSNGDLIVNGNFNNPIDSDEETGFHIGVLSEIKLPFWMYIRPELVYTHTESSYSNEFGENAKLKKDLIEAPILFGFRILRIGRFFFGPSFQYAISTDLNSSSLDNIKNISSDDFTVAGQVGLGLNFGRFGADIRYEVGLSDTDAIFVGNIDDILSTVNIDTSQQQFILSFYYKFNKAPKK